MSSILEVCVDNFESALIAEKNGANRIELCSNLIIGGTTPSFALVKDALKNLSIPVNVLIRPRFGDFCYNESEMRLMEQEIEEFCKMGIHGIVIGCLTVDGNLDIKNIQRLISSAKKINKDIFLTLHRAFDMCIDAEKSFFEAEKLGFNAILTSGQKETCLEGKALLQKLSYKSSNVEIMAGGGLKPELIQEMAKDTNIRNFHLSCKKVIQSPMQYRNKDVTMSFKGISEYEQWVTDGEMVAKAKKSLS